MRPPRLVVALIVALALSGALVALVVSQKPALKEGVYSDGRTQVSFRVAKDLKTITVLGGPCMKGGKLSSTWFLDKRTTLAHGTFSFSHEVLLDPNTVKPFKHRIKATMKMTGTWSDGAFTGTVVEQDGGAGCEPASFKTKYWGVNPPG